MVSVLVDHSMHILSSAIFEHAVSNKIISLLKKTIRWFGKQLVVLIDHELQFLNKHSKSDFNLCCTQN